MAEDRTPRTLSPSEPADEIEERAPERRRRASHHPERHDRRSRASEEKLLQPSDDSDRAAERGPGNRFS